MESETSWMIKVPKSEWYAYNLECGHTAFSKVRLMYEKPGRQIHKIRCPVCDSIIRFAENSPGYSAPPTAWNQVTEARPATNAEMSNVPSGHAFILPNRIMRIDNGKTSTGNPFPYTSRDRDY